ncbi:tyrosine--tRNA ligase [Pseudokordiimonas caeni]|uniref:tyrosine--tRNA ligase n=1 Tax=Pseudokordiimonas caeni TaxID=2997908 RepID=UPI002811E0ED|nr:tyrosine--tRNA ligase [Pseudokordiimonas caeni]
MSASHIDFLRILQERGFVHQITDEAALADQLKKGPITAYIGFDCTAPSLHVGSLVQIMMLRWLQKTGNKPIVLMGGGTTRIGDPTGRDESRKMLTDADINANMDGIRSIFSQFLTFGDTGSDAIMVNNDDWLSKLSYIEMLRDVGTHFTINRMLTFDSVKLRLEREQPMTFLEFNYMILQAYDFMELHRRHKCVLQMGGSDQWGNIVNGMELTRRTDGAHVIGLTTPLVTLADGKKMGKTAAGAVWLNEAQLPAYDYWQFWRNTQDADVGKFLRLFTELPMDEVARLEALGGSEINHAKAVLANEATTLCRGRAAAEAAEATAREVFEKGGAGEDLPTISVKAGTSLVDALVGLGLASSKGDARRQIQQGAVKVNNNAVSDVDAVIDAGTELIDGKIKLSKGKKNHGLLSLEG